MRKYILSAVFAGTVCFLSTGCATRKVPMTPKSADYTTVEGMKLREGYARLPQPWLVYSDREENAMQLKRRKSAGMSSKSEFLSTFVVLDERDDMLKLAAYKPGLIDNGRMKRKAVKKSGWLPKDKVLLWNSSLKNKASGNVPKAVLVSNSSDVLLSIDKYLENDSIKVFTAPSLTNTTGKKLAVGQLVYLYKQSEDGQRFMIGAKPAFEADSVKNEIYGWVSKNVVSIWGEQTAIKPKANDLSGNPIGFYEDPVAKKEFKPIVTDAALFGRSNFERTFPVISYNEQGKNTQTNFLINPLNYEANKIYNILGNPIYYSRFKEILDNNRKLNVVFVVDMSQNNRLYLPLVKSFLQELQLKFINPGYYEQVKFGGVVYKDNVCGSGALSSSLSDNYRDVTTFLEQKVAGMSCSDTYLEQPVNSGLIEASRLLNSAANETNIVVVIGTTGTDEERTQSAIQALTRVNARMIFFQTQAKSDNAYNNFVLLAEKIVTNSAENIAMLKKEKIVNQNDFLISNNFSLAQEVEGTYALDFPNTSMTQGFVLFPKKGQTMPAKSLKAAIDAMIAQVTSDNQRIDSSLNAYFKSDIGANLTTVNPEFKTRFVGVDGVLPPKTASFLLDNRSVLLATGYLQEPVDLSTTGMEHGVFLNDAEYDQLYQYYYHIAKRAFKNDKFNRRRAIKHFVKITAKSKPKFAKIKKSKLRNNSMAYSVKVGSGFIIQDPLFNDLTVKQWSGSSKIETGKVRAYFERYKALAAKMATNKSSDAIKVNHKGQVFYWLNNEYLPNVN